MSIFNEFNKKEKPFFTGIARGFGFGGGGGAAAGPGINEFFEFEVWGGGGGGGENAGSVGGAGAYVTAQYQIQPGTTLKFIVGAGGRYKDQPIGVQDVAYGGGGAIAPLNYPSSTGAGLSGIFITPANIYSDADSPASDGVTDSPTGPQNVVQPGFSATNALIIAAGGGGASYDGGGGGGGIEIGGDAEPTTDTGAQGRGGTWGGAGSDSGSGGGPSPRGGGLGYGGRDTGGSGGGGGGSGLYGGSAGTNGGTVASGGGGSSYYWTTQSKPSNFVAYNPGSVTATAGNPGFDGSNPGVVGGIGPNNPGTFGQGKGPNSNGGNGRIAYRKADSFGALPGASWVILDYTGSTQTVNV